MNTIASRAPRRAPQRWLLGLLLTIPAACGGDDTASTSTGSATEGSATEGSATEGSATEGSATEGSATETDSGGIFESPWAPVACGMTTCEPDEICVAYCHYSESCSGGSCEAISAACQEQKSEDELVACLRKICQGYGGDFFHEGRLVCEIDDSTP